MNPIQEASIKSFFFFFFFFFVLDNRVTLLIAGK